MKIEVNPHPGTLYDLVVDDIIEMSNESFELVSAVRYALMGYQESSEATKIADKIRKSHSRS